MNKRKYINMLISMVVLGALGTGLYIAVPFLVGPGSSAPEASSLYTCPMHPQVIQDSPGQCPICGMDLVPMKPHLHDDGTLHGGEGASGADTMDDANGDDAAQSDSSRAPPIVRVEPAVIQKMGVNTEIVSRREITKEIRAVAHIDFAENAEAVVNARFDGWVEKLYVNTTGARVRRGQALAGIYSPELVATQEEYLQLYKSKTELGDSPEVDRLLRAARRRLEYWNISANQIAALEKRGAPSRLLRIHSPISGVIVEKNVVAGAKLAEGTDLFRIVDLSTVWAYIHIPEKDIPFVETGLPVQMIVPQVPGEAFQGKVSFIFPFMRAESRDLRVRVSFSNREGRLKPGMYATLKLRRTLDGEFLTVPSSAVIRTGERTLAFVYRGNGAFEPRIVTPGVVDENDRLQILEGLAEHEAVVTSGQFLLDSESRIQEAVRKMRGSATSGSGDGGMNGGDEDMDDATNPMGGHNH
ncbi:MAG: efflux RND transporter periplasmic adaptor subunit [bacterium]|nr:efflux RND transporter periplasmic adaptor subunit [bacterium]